MVTTPPRRQAHWSRRPPSAHPLARPPLPRSRWQTCGSPAPTGSAATQTTCTAGSPSTRRARRTRCAPSGTCRAPSCRTRSPPSTASPPPSQTPRPSTRPPRRPSPRCPRSPRSSRPTGAETSRSRGCRTTASSLGSPRRWKRASAGSPPSPCLLRSRRAGTEESPRAGTAPARSRSLAATQRTKTRSRLDPRGPSSVGTRSGRSSGSQGLSTSWKRAPRRLSCVGPFEGCGSARAQTLPSPETCSARQVTRHCEMAPVQLGGNKWKVHRTQSIARICRRMQRQGQRARPLW
mmetsp:Transcript_20435/g.41391  ORF Transcript_20435/g.41391 Transcript_20435/m.41391 type:complete len:292 (-) Transcript_20435:190-1065(-)